MMLSNADRFGHFDIRLCDTARFPLDRLGNREVYNRTFEVVSFVCSVVSRLNFIRNWR
jgi:hypothetical protein